jgi:hypothetical protein
MQRKYIDHNDFEHLVNTLGQDFKPLNNKIKKIEQRAKHGFGTIKSRNDHSEEIWKCPVSKNVWTIHYFYSCPYSEVEVDIFPITEFSSLGGEKEFLMITTVDKLELLGSKLPSLKKVFDPNDKDVFRDYLVKNNLYIIIFRGHFIDRYRLRTGNTSYFNFQVMSEFCTNPNFALVENFQQNQDWTMFLHFKGVAMIRQDSNYIVFDTFVSKSELKENQITAIQNHLKNLDEYRYGVVGLHLLASDEWIEYLDKDRILAWMLDVVKEDPMRAKSIIISHRENLDKLFGQSFIEKLRSAYKPSE